MYFDEDLKLAQKLQEEEYSNSAEAKESFLDVGNQKLLRKVLEENEYADSKTSLIDPDLELSDPTPDIHLMFVGFNKRFFWGRLEAVEVVWSPRMTQCAGICRYRSKNGACSVHLSLPLLKLRPRKDLIETLLHEMIHAYLFVTNNNRDRDGHGPEFHSHMNRINREAGTNITVYHSFHAEVDLYKTHWWRCNGRCQTLKPFYGLVRRSMNRAPGPNDFWWANHQKICGGTFIKVREPENYKTKGRQKGSGKTGTSVKTIQNYFPSNSPGTKTDTKDIKKGSKKSLGQTNENENIPPHPSRTAADVIPFSGKGFVIGTQESLPVSEKPWLKRLDANLEKKPGSASGTLKPFLKRIGKPSTSTVENVHNKSVPSSSAQPVTNKSVPSTSAQPVTNKSVPSTSAQPVTNKSVPSTSAQPVTNKAVPSTSAQPVTNKSVPSTSAQPVTNKSVPSTSAQDQNCSEPKKLKISEEAKDIICYVSCPVCQKSIEDTSINEHLDSCLNISEKHFAFKDCMMCGSGLDQPSKEPTICEVCKGFVASDESSDFGVVCEDRIINCALCKKEMRSGDVERHLENCDALHFKNV